MTGEQFDPCPWCGAEGCVRVGSDFQGLTTVQVECECGVRGPRALSESQSVWEWNRIAEERTATQREAVAENEKLRERLRDIRALVDAQAEDLGLWFDATTAPEAYLQRALRLLHATVEGDEVIRAELPPELLKEKTDAAE